MGAIPVPVGVVGADEAGNALLGHFRSLGVSTAGIRTVGGYMTPTKTRVLAGAAHANPQQVLRIDRGAGLEGARTARAIAATLAKVVGKADAVVISDYGYGAVDPALAPRLLRADIPVTLDSRHRLLEYSGLTAATPNEPEIEAALGITIDNDLEKLEAAGRKVLRMRRHRALLVTRGRHGMALFEPRRKTVHIPIVGTDEVADVTGAGDTVIAAFTLALAAGGSFVDAARLANHAGGLAVMKHGTQPVGISELAGSIARRAGELA
jgi:rfaE bifunctional protein kinase chain/domain